PGAPPPPGPPPLSGVGPRPPPPAVALPGYPAPGGPAAEVREHRDAVRDPLVQRREEVVPVIHPTHGPVEGLATTGVPIRFSAARAGFDRPAPALGEHNDAVYREKLGYSPEEIAELAAESVI
ncbi:CoA transferase, partial [Streptomyces olivaceus]|uniref:CoA transferase n=1 Tax=Streptomyces olivaceus TaxID=47716 RepID=UPI00365EF251